MAEPAVSGLDLSGVLPGVTVGHWTDVVARTGCTVVLLPEGTVASGEVRGGAPATRELDLLAPERLVDRIDAVLLTGGSAFGLAAADGVVRFLEQNGRGFPTAVGPVPIVPGLGLFDLPVGDASVRPGADEGLAAAASASAAFSIGSVGAGTGSTVGKWRGPDVARPAGIGAALVERGGIAVVAIIAVNAFGDIDDPDDRTALVDRVPAAPDAPAIGDLDAPFGNTTIGLLVTNARLTKTDCLLVAQSGHDGLARAIFPSHTRFDGDALVAAATGTAAVTTTVDEVRMLAVAAVVDAARSVL